MADLTAPEIPSNTVPLVNNEITPASAAPDAKSALAARKARFAALKAQKETIQAANKAAVATASRENGTEGQDAELQKLQRVHAQNVYKLERQNDPDFERKQAMTYTAEEDEKWNKRGKKRARNKDDVAFSDWRRQANKVYKRQIKQMSKVDMEAYAAAKAKKLQEQVVSGLLDIVETPDGEIYTVDNDGRINTPVEENYNCDHKPSKEAVDRLVADLDKAEQARLKARAARGIKEQDDSGDVTYINVKNKQFNEKLARFYDRYTTEIRDSFERGTAI